jgi:hypothetical protein
LRSLTERSVAARVAPSGATRLWWWPQSDFTLEEPELSTKLNTLAVLFVPLLSGAQHGADGIGIVDIMKEAGLTQGAFSGHFSSKEELLREALDEGFRRAPFVPPELIGEPLDTLNAYSLLS